MAKSINWPACFATVIENEPNYTPLMAVRVGRLTYDNHYWVPDEVVDIRADQQVIRPARIIAPLRCLPIAELPPEVYSQLKPTLRTQAELMEYLAQQYNQVVLPTTEVTLVAYMHIITCDRDPASFVALAEANEQQELGFALPQGELSS